jgi:serine/threonine-protein kinase
MDEAGDVTWKVASVTEYSRTVAHDGVISQSPLPGTALRDGGTVTLRVSLGPPLVQVPAVAGKDVDAAKALLGESRLVPGQILRQADEANPDGTVLTWEVAGTRDKTPVPEQTVVDLVVSSGPAPRVVPAVAGRSEADATAAVQGVQLKTARREAFSDTVEAGTVIATDPGQGSSVPRDSTVTLVVSKGPDLVAMPNLIGMNAEQAARALEKAGLVGNTTGALGGKVWATDPVAKTLVRRGSTVDVAFKR